MIKLLCHSFLLKIGGRVMARQIKLGYGNQIYFSDNNGAVKYQNQTIHQCNNPRDWKNGGDGYIKDLCNKNLGEVAKFLGYRI